MSSGKRKKFNSNTKQRYLSIRSEVHEDMICWCTLKTLVESVTVASLHGNDNFGSWLLIIPSRPDDFVFVFQLPYVFA